ncbi:hypothetical protein PLESTB_001494900 [Pleodorina starrii]|uniref:EF-hand domain-containing protein n=1 Tax=Pleodorina starrii TaxID=330485 RepID=A0A9W6BWR7_9CHLO|nr:hypothetical protein PLESTB_001494900 [Pleodorina starrii]
MHSQPLLSRARSAATAARPRASFSTTTSAAAPRPLPPLRSLPHPFRISKSRTPLTRPLPQPARFQDARKGSDHDRGHASVDELLSTSSLDEMLHAAHVVLKSAERRVGDYCSTFAPAGAVSAAAAEGGGRGRGGGGGRGRGRSCWHVYRSLRQARRRLEAEAGAEAVTTGHAGPACADVESLEKMVRELEYVPSEDLYRVLAANEKLLGSMAAGTRARERGAWVDRAACAIRGAAAGGESSGGEGGGEWENELSGAEAEVEAAEAAEAARKAAEAAAAARRAEGGEGGSGRRGVGGLAVVEGLDRDAAAAVFSALDRGGRGWLDRDDLLAGLDKLGEHLDPSDVEQICLELGSSGRIDLQTFCDIAEAERLVVPGSDAIFLRRLRHNPPDWWGERPNFLDAA